LLNESAVANFACVSLLTHDAIANSTKLNMNKAHLMFFMFQYRFYQYKSTIYKPHIHARPIAGCF
jgi:hypothetical protein